MRRVEHALVAGAVAAVVLRLALLGHWRALLLALVAGAVYRFVSPGARAALATVLAAMMLVGGILAVVAISWDGFRPIDASGLLLLPLGAGALAAAVLALLSRPRTTRTRRAVRWALTAVSVVALAVFVIVPTGSAIWIVGKPRIPVRSFSVPHRDVTLHTRDGVRLAAWYVPSRNGAAVVLVHGAGGSRDGLKLHAALLARHGYGVLLYDARGRGASSGRSNGFGWDWSRDLEAAVDYAEARGIHRVGVLGLSTGAEVAVTTAAHDRRIRAVVADGLQARTLDDFEHGGKSDVPYWLAALAAVHLVRSGAPEPLDRLVPLIKPRPFLIVAGTKDKGDSTYDDTWARADGRPGVLWKADAAHTKALATFPREYERRVVGLFDRALLHAR